jgi:hypothetical protein
MGRAVRTSRCSRGHGGPEARLRSAFRILSQSAFYSVATSLWQIALELRDQLHHPLATLFSWCVSTEPASGV